MNILLTNDDGYLAPGIRTLATALTAQSDYQVYIVAPERERSAVGHAITLHKPLHVREETSDRPNLRVYSVSGTPADCTKLAVKAILPQPPDIVLSGINLGANLGTDVYYSGTVSAAIEATLLGLPALAVSLVAEGPPVDFEPAAAETARVVAKILSEGLPARTLLNLNLPIDGWNSLQVTRLGRRTYQDIFDQRRDPRGRTYYWLGGGIESVQGQEGTDVWAVSHGYGSLTPLRLALTDHDFIPTLAAWNL